MLGYHLIQGYGMNMNTLKKNQTLKKVYKVKQPLPKLYKHLIVTLKPNIKCLIELIYLIY